MRMFTEHDDNKPTKCLLDLDGVLVDWMAGVIKHFNINQKMFDDAQRPLNWLWILDITGLTKDEFFKQLSVDFWRDLEWTSDGQEILSLVEAEFGHDNICLLTSHSASGPAAHGKVLWIEKHLSHYADQLLIGTAKHFCSHYRSLLVDDGEHNIDFFIDHDGQGILVPRPWNRLHGKDPITHLKQRLEQSWLRDLNNLKKNL